MRIRPIHWIVALAVGIGFFMGLTAGSGVVRAEQKFGPDDVKSVPQTFLEGGDRSYAQLKEIHATLRRMETLLSTISRNTAGGTPSTKPAAAPARVQKVSVP